MVDGHAIELWQAARNDRFVRTGELRPPQLAPVPKKERFRHGLGLSAILIPRARSERESIYRENVATVSNHTDLVALRLMTKIDPANFRKQADECHQRADEARNPIDQEAWRRLAEDFIKLAKGLEQVTALASKSARR